MCAFMLRGPAAEISRARHIAEVLVRNGLGALAETIGLTRFIPRGRAQRDEADARSSVLSMPQRLRHTLEELGPTYIKLGQVLSTRPDVLPPAYVVELSKLLDAAPAVPAPEVMRMVEQELGGPATSFYTDFDPVPIASASIGQVHRAALLDGSRVVVKVQRPGAERMIQADLSLLATQARFLEARSQTLRNHRLVDLVEEFAQALRDELDYRSEGRNADRLRQIVRDDDIAIPRVYWELTTRRVITLSDLQGIKLSDPEALKAQGYAPALIAERLVNAYLKQVFVHGVFHADPHPANILICAGQVGLVDFGVVGYLTPRIRQDLGELILAVVQQNADDIVHVFTRIGAMGPATDRDTLRRDVQRMVVRYYNASLESVPIAQLLGDVMTIAFKHHIRLPADLALLVRTMVVLEGVALSLDPSIVVSDYLEPFVVQLVRERASARSVLLESIKSLRELQALVQVLPRRVDSLTDQLERGAMTVGVEVRHLSQAMRKLDAIGNRLAFSVIVAGLIVGSALVLLGGERAATFRLPFTSINLPIPQIGFVVAGLLGIWLLFSIVRSKGL